MTIFRLVLPKLFYMKYNHLYIVIKELFDASLIWWFMVWVFGIWCNNVLYVLLFSFIVIAAYIVYGISHTMWAVVLIQANTRIPCESKCVKTASFVVFALRPNM